MNSLQRELKKKREIEKQKFYNKQKAIGEKYLNVAEFDFTGATESKEALCKISTAVNSYNFVSDEVAIEQIQIPSIAPAVEATPYPESSKIVNDNMKQIYEVTAVSPSITDTKEVLCDYEHHNCQSRYFMEKNPMGSRFNSKTEAAIEGGGEQTHNNNSDSNCDSNCNNHNRYNSYYGMYREVNITEAEPGFKYKELKKWQAEIITMLLFVITAVRRTLKLLKNNMSVVMVIGTVCFVSLVVLILLLNRKRYVLDTPTPLENENYEYNEIL